MDVNAQEFLSRYEAAANSRLFDNVQPLISEQAIFWFSDGSHVGRDQIRTAFEQTWSTIQNDVYRISDVTWIVDEPALAVCVYTFRSEGDVQGQHLVYVGRGTSVLRKESGEWRVVHEHLSSMPR